jgi:hypothetical protein
MNVGSMWVNWRGRIRWDGRGIFIDRGSAGCAEDNQGESEGSDQQGALGKRVPQ